MRIRLILAVLTLLVGGIPCASAQQTPRRTDTPKADQTKAAKKPPIADAVRLSTSEALANVAREKAAKTNSDSTATAGDGVVEFHEAAPHADSPKGGALKINSKKSPLKDIHGETYGLAGGGPNLEGGKAGAHSKDGKTSVFIEADHAADSPAH